jgi:hypothetical protein
MEREHVQEAENGEILMPEFEVKRIADGLGYGDGGISHEDRKEVVGEEIAERVEAAIESPTILVDVSTDKSGNMIDDDGCGDGRKRGRIFEGLTERFKSLHRSKVFGGGATMATAGIIGMGRAAGKTLRQAFSAGVSLLNDREIDFGAHTDTHSHHHEDNCGCGAVDKAPAIVANVVKFKDKIRQSVLAFTDDVEDLDEVFASYEGYSNEIADQPYAGSEVMTEIADNGKIIKELEDDHFEMYVIINKVEGKTVDQEVVREASDGQVHTFAVDEWRIKQLADRMYPEPEFDDKTRHKAYLSELVYTLATAATLTKGDLPVYVVENVAATQPEPIAA